MLRRTTLKFVIWILSASIIGLSTYQWSRCLLRPALRSTKTPMHHQKELIYVLGYTPFHNLVPWTKANPQLFHGCIPPYDNCVMTSDVSMYDRSRAVIFHMYRPYRWIRNLTRRSDQYFVMAMWEPPTVRLLEFGVPLDPFNLTMTYRSDSDIYWPYGKFSRRVSPPQRHEHGSLLRILSKKTRLVSWMVSRCQTTSARAQYVDRLRKYVAVDIFGECGTMKCPHDPDRSPTTLGNRNRSACDRVLSRYKFYLAFENSLCAEYVTEKFFERMQKSYVIPVVLERSIVLDSIRDANVRRAINRSFIAADDFDHPRALAEYLKYLHTNPSEYLKYFEWRREYKIEFEDDFKPWCDLCRILNEAKPRVMQKDVTDWWVKEAKCHVFEQGKRVE